MRCWQYVYMYVLVAAVRVAELHISSKSSDSRPNIVFIVADDLGYNDLGFNNPDMITPNIDKLATQGVILNQSYVHPVCSPSRSAFLTGYYPHRLGMQHLVIFPEQPACLPLNVTLLPQKLKSLGYATHIVGKWHLGFCNWNCTPTYRGFDSFYGYYNGAEDYYTHSLAIGKFNGLDIRDNEKPDTTEKGTYSAHLFAKKASEIILRHNTSQPLYLYLPFQSVHAPIEVPKYYEDMYKQIHSTGRRKFSGMVTAMDEAIGNITRTLKKARMDDNTLIVFTADNGGWPLFFGNNFPLRGGKVTIWEGGTRGIAFIHGKMLKKTGYRYTGLIHAVDWFPTLLAAAGDESDSSIDGVNQWLSIRDGGTSARTEFVYHLDNYVPATQGAAAIRMGDWKLIEGTVGLYDGWFPPPMTEEDEKQYGLKISESERLMQHKKQRLFNIQDDPNEHKDLAEDPAYQSIVQRLHGRLEQYRKQMVPANYPPNDPDSNPSKHGGAWGPSWC